MSNRSLLEFNHDYCPTTTVGCLDLGHALRKYMRAPDPDELPPGVELKHYRHHSEPEPIKALADALREARAWIVVDAAGPHAVALIDRIDAALKAAGVDNG